MKLKAITYFVHFQPLLEAIDQSITDEIDSNNLLSSTTDDDVTIEYEVSSDVLALLELLRPPTVVRMKLRKQKRSPELKILQLGGNARSNAGRKYLWNKLLDRYGRRAFSS